MDGAGGGVCGDECGEADASAPSLREEVGMLEYYA